MKRGIIFLLILLICISFSNSGDFSGNSIVGVNNKDGSIVMVDKDGSFVELEDTMFADWKDLTLADIDGDGLDEIIGLRDFSAALYIYDFEEGSLKLKALPEDIGQFSRDLDWVGVKSYDFDFDNKEELLLINNEHGRFFMIDYEDDEFYVDLVGDSSWKDWIGFDIGKHNNQIKVFAIRQDKNPVYVFDYLNGQFDDDNSINIGEQIGNNPMSDITVFDINSDGENEIVVESDGSIYVGKIKNTFYNLETKQELSYKDVERLTYGDILNNGNLKLLSLRGILPFTYYDHRTDSLVEKPINYNKNLRWVGFDIGNIGYSEIAPVVEEPVIEEPEPEEEVVEEIMEEEESEEVVEEESEGKDWPWLWILIGVVLLILIGIGIFLYFRYRGTPEFVDEFYEKVDEDLKKKKEKKEREEKEKEKEEKEEPIVKKKVTTIKKEEKKVEEDLWPKDTRSSDLDSLRKLIKKRRK